MNDEEDGAFISNREIFDEVLAMRDDVRSLVQDRMTSDRIQFDQEERIRSLERWKYAVPVGGLGGAIAGIAAVARAVGKG